MQISRAKDADVQKALAEAYEPKSIPGNQVLAIREIVEQRNLSGKTVSGAAYRSEGPRKQVTAAALVRAYQKETRQKMLIKKATLARSRLLFLVNALRRLVDDEHFTTLLRDLTRMRMRSCCWMATSDFQSRLTVVIPRSAA
jgi:ParB family chromosome partitioning protein